tara:strand:+ start:140 stop:2323 length:2184 start_codon:yes stop_codon:yes gene_type:complete
VSGAFEKLARPIQKWIRQQGWRELRDIQARTIHAVYADCAKDLIVAASTAGGKTEAAFLPLISQVLDTPSQQVGFDLLYVGPLKALITDQADRLKDICSEAELSVTPWHGDVSQSIKIRALKRPSGILLITPESLEALFLRRGMEVPRLFGATRAVVVDELHSMLDSERGVQMRSLLTRLELSTGRKIQRVGLSATLGDMELARKYLRPEDPENVALIESEGGEAELQLQLRGYTLGDGDQSQLSTTDAIADHIFEHLRGRDNLVFAGSRQSVEIYADRLRELCEREHLPQEFYPHHASLSREHRDFVERRLKDPSKPTTAVCTSTLELGIDIGDISCVAQIGAPFSVSALRQRLGRSGRREGQPAILRQYAIEACLNSESSFVDRLRLGLVRSVAMIELLLEGWCEPPKPQALHLSTLVHQVLSVIAERGGASASTLHRILCQAGPFKLVSSPIFADLLRALGDPDVELLEQADDGQLLLGRAGEKLVEHYGFYAVFQTPEEYRLVAEGQELGTLPIDNVLAPGTMVIFSGRRWLVLEVSDQDKVVTVMPAAAGTPPVFGGDPGEVHDTVVERMFALLESDCQPIYMDDVSTTLLKEARRSYAELGFRSCPIFPLGEKSYAVATRCGSIKSASLALALRSHGFDVELHDGFLVAKTRQEDHDIYKALRQIGSANIEEFDTDGGRLVFEKFHPYLPVALLKADALSCRIDFSALPQMCDMLLQQQGD